MAALGTLSWDLVLRPTGAPAGERETVVGTLEVDLSTTTPGAGA